MSRIKQFWSGFFLNASVLRTYGETLLVFTLLTVFTLLVFEVNAGPVTLTSQVFFIGPFSALYYAVRLRIPEGRWYRRIGLDLLWLAGPIVVFNPLVWFATRTFLIEMFAYANDMRGVDTIFIGLLGFSYLFFRVAIQFIMWWDALRQRRVIWSLVSSNLVAVALLQAIVVLPLTVALFSSTLADVSGAGIPDSALAHLLYRLQLLLPLIGVGMLMAATVLILLLPVSTAVSFFFARPIRRRLDVLLDAAHAARDGNYDTQIVVSGHDEIARLQSDFNVMTANLKINIDALRDEREKVATLLKTRRELMANVSHELRTPIATVRAYLDSALRQQNQEAVQTDHQGDVVILSQHDAEVIRRETLRLQVLIDDLFALSRAEVDQLEMKSTPIDVIPLIQGVVETVSPLAWRMNRVEIVTRLPLWMPSLVADGARLEQVLRNLIHNSLRHTSPGGLVIVSAEARDRWAEIRVQDTGEGIAPEHLPYIWERYYRDSENGGTGLGLALVKSFVTAMGGQVDATSTLGDGACFTVRLPLSASESDDSPVGQSASDTSSLPKPQPVLKPASAKSVRSVPLSR